MVMMISSHHRARLHAYRAAGASALALAFALGAAGEAFAQTAPAATAPAASADGQAVEEVVVTGLRASLQRSIDVKRNSNVIVDSIASEDLGKFPDSNVAESLQRITGVSIDRSGGEGRFVTVRGFGPSFNELLLNGRTLATENAGRQFSFDLLPAELISGADVYKTTDASLQEGGIGATINLKTPRPFDIRGQRLVLSAKGEYEDLSGNVSPEAFGLYSNTFLDGRLGVLGSVSYQKRDARIDSALDDGYYKTPVAGNLSNVFVPQDYNQVSDTEERERITASGTLQYRFSDSLLLTVDGVYNKFTVDSVANQVGHYFSPDQFSNVVADPNGTVTSFDQSATGHTDFVSRTFNRPTELKSAGVNLAWKPSSQFSLKFDSSWSKATDDSGGKQNFLVIGYNNPVHFDGSGSGLPSITTANSVTDATAGRAHFVTREGFDIAETVYEDRIDGEYKTNNSFFTGVRFGGIYTDRTKTNQLIRSDANAGCVYCGYGIPVPQGLLQQYDPGSFLSGESGNFPRKWLSFDPEAYFAFLSTQAAGNAEDVAAGRPLGASYGYLQSVGFFNPVLYPASYRVGEQVAGGYVQTDFKGDIDGLPWGATLGVRYVHTDLQSTGQQQTLTDLLSIAGDTTSYTAVYSPGTPPVSRKTSYDDWLPTLNARLDLTPEMLVRFAASRTVTRPNLTDVAPQINYTNLRPGNLQASGGNPDLQPYKSFNLDTSYEWYYQKGGYFTLGVFYKDLSDFIVNGVGQEVFTLQPGPNSAYPGEPPLSTCAVRATSAAPRCTGPRSGSNTASPTCRSRSTGWGSR